MPKVAPLALDIPVTNAFLTKPPLKQGNLVKDALYPAPEKEMALLNIPLTKPTLPIPQIALIYQMERLSKLQEECLNLSSSRIDCHMKETEDLSQEHLLLYKEIAEKMQTDPYYSTLREAGGFLSAALSFYISASIGGPAGAAFLAAGLASLGSSQKELWSWAADLAYPDNKEKREQFLRIAPVVMVVLSIGMGIAATKLAGPALLAIFANQAVEVFQYTVKMIEGACSLGEGLSKAQLNSLQGKSEELKGKLFENEHQLEQLKTEFERMVSSISDAHARMARIISLTAEASSQMTRG